MRDWIGRVFGWQQEVADLRQQLREAEREQAQLRAQASSLTDAVIDFLARDWEIEDGRISTAVDAKHLMASLVRMGGIVRRVPNVTDHDSPTVLN